MNFLGLAVMDLVCAVTTVSVGYASTAPHRSFLASDNNQSSQRTHGKWPVRHVNFKQQASWNNDWKLPAAKVYAFL
jgi:hypothetical protein